MTKEEAIKRLKEYAQYSYGIWHNDEEDTKAFDMAIEALQDLSKPNNTCEVDLISRQDAIAYLAEHMTWYSEDGYEADEEEKDDVITDLVNGIPSADRPTGEWVSEDGTPSGAAYSVYCSRCGQWSEYRGFFCLWCGAKMGGRAND